MKMARGGRKKRGNDRFFPPAHGPRFPMCPAEPPPPDIGWNRSPFPDGPPGCPDRDFRLMENSVGCRPMREPDYGPLDERAFGPVDQDFRLFNRGLDRIMDQEFRPDDDMGHSPARTAHYGQMDSREPRGPVVDRTRITDTEEFRNFVQLRRERDFAPLERDCGAGMNRDFGPIGNSKWGPVGDRDFGPIGEFGPVDRNYTPRMNERGFGSLMLSERGPGSVNDREFDECQEERGVFIDDQRAFPGPPDQDVGVTMCHDPRTMQQPGWIDTSGIPPPGPYQTNQINPRMPEPPKPEPLEDELPKPPASKKSRPSHNTGSTKPPPGRFQGVISFVGSDYGFIERDDLKKIYFSFDAFWGDTAEMLPGVQVQFTVYKEMGKEYATDVVVPPGGTEEVDSEVFQGVISKVPDLPGEGKPRKGPPPKYTGCIQATLYSGSTELPFGPQDSKPTLLLNDHVQFNLLTNLVTKQKRAINIKLLPETFQFTSESREMGVIMSMKDGSGSIMSEQLGKICFDANENLDDADLSIMDEVEFTVVPTKGLDQRKAVRVRKLPEGTVTFGSKTREKIAEVIRMEGPSASLTLEKGKWKPVTSEVLPQRTVVFEDVSSEQYEGTVIKAIHKVSERKQVDSEPDPQPGLLVTRVAGVEQELPFGPDDVLSEATMMQGDRVQFNISTNRGTKVERATNIEILPDTFSQSKEQREKGVVVDLRESFGFIKCQRDPRLFFHLREVMEESKLNLTDEVEFTILSSESAGEGDQAVRIRKLLWTAFTATPKLEGLGAAGKEKKKMTIKLLRDSVNEEMKNLKVKIESFSTEDFPQEPADPLDEECSSGKPDDIHSVPVKSESASLLAEVEAEPKGEGRHRERSRSAERRWSGRSWRQRSPAGEHARGRSRSRSREWGHRYEHKCSWSRSRSRSRERSGRGSRRWSRSRSRERTSVRYGRRSDSRERAANQARRRSRSPSPAWDGGSRRKRSTNDAHAGHPIVRDRSREAPHTVQLDQSTQEVPRRNDILDDELVRKKRELELLEEQIARKRAIIAMEQKGLTPKVHPKEEQDYDSHLPTDNGYYRCRLPLESEHDTPLKDVRPAPGPIKSILKKRAEPFESDNYLQTEFTKKPSLDQNFLSQSHFDQPSGDHSLHQISVRHSHFSEPSDHPSLGHPVSQHVPVHHPPLEQSAPHQIPPHPPTHSQSSVDQPPVCHSPPDREPAPKSNISTQFDRFLRILNKGVDVNLLTTLVRETREETAAYEKQTAHQLPQNEVPYKNQDPYKDSYGRRPEEQEDLGESSQDFLLPHERAFQDGIGFSRIVGMKHGVQEEEPYWKEGDVEDEERFLYGERAFVDQDERETSAPPDRKHRGPSPSWPAAEKPLSVADGEDKMQHYDKIQSLLQTIGLDLDTAEVSKLTDRTRERLYGKKLKAKPPGSAEREWERRRSRTGSPESEQTRSVSPVQLSRREVYMSYSSTLEHSSAHNQRSHREVHIDSRTVQHTQESVPPSATQYPHTSSESYPMYEGGQHEHPYNQHGGTVPTSWDHVPSHSDVQSPQAFSQHPESFVGPAPPFSIDPNGLSQFFTSPTVPQVPLASPMGLPHGLPPAYASLSSVPLPPFVGQLSSAVLPFAGAASHYPMHPLTGAPIIPQASLGGAIFAASQTLAGSAGDGAKQVKESPTTKSRCLRVIKTVNLLGQVSQKKGAVSALKEVPLTEQSSAPSPAPLPTSSEATEKRQVATISEDDIKAKQKKRLEQFNERMRQKKEQQKEALRTRAESQKVPPGVLEGP
ncbi:uncharacterized protein si:dkeyp-121d4.3 isoform X2 [Megalops cyprinoides]|uniref:uncharacterized protein si:dkeyp-121d4.3 isoform X2 n=1 Tax=Megalops cyprinoides TaxID=118141 RepID=UPI00186557B3|nr:uncharacterized protein si:dkeyp-121d4.3 isoform X2 [Megalops cyprinoides]